MFNTQTTKMTMAGYECLVVGPRGNADMVLIMLHGFGASCTDFVPFVESLSRSKELLGIRVLHILPQAPGFPPQWCVQVLTCISLVQVNMCVYISLWYVLGAGWHPCAQCALNVAWVSASAVCIGVDLYFTGAGEYMCVYIFV